MNNRTFHGGAGGNSFTKYFMTLTATGDGTGVSTQTLAVSSNITVTLDGNGYFYTDAAGTLGQTQTWSVASGGDRTMYIKVTSGSSKMTFSDVRKVTKFSEPYKGSYINEKSTSGSVAGLTSLTVLECFGNNTLSGSVTALTLLNYLNVWGDNTLSGSVAALTLLIRLYVLGSNVLSGSLAALTSLTYLVCYGSNTLSGSLATNFLTKLTAFILNPCAMVAYTAGQVWPSMPVTISPSAGYGYTSTMIDNILIDMAAGTMAGRTITLQGSSAARTAASNAAVATLIGAGRLNTVLTN